MIEPSPHSCAKCGYTLTGLGRVGTCPECGSIFNTASGRGVNTQPHEMHIAPDRAKAKLWIIIHSLIIAFAWGSDLFVILFYRPDQYPIWMLLMLLVGVNSLVGIFEARRELQKLRGPV